MLSASRVMPTGQPQSRLANIASAVKPPGTTSFGSRKMSTESAIRTQPATMSAASKKMPPVTLPQGVRHRIRRRKRSSGAGSEKVMGVLS